MTLAHLFTGILPKKRESLAIFFLLIFSLIGLFLYSFTQVDLSLTITRTSFWQPIQHAFQYIGYFNRPLSTLFYLLIIGMLCLSYLLFLHLARRGDVTVRTVWFVIIFIGILFIFSYSAFSYDIFNYIFDAKIITHYGENPYIRKALDYPSDPMLSFMHWTHRTYPYGPSWLLLTVPVSFIGFSYFVPTYFLFKGLIILCYIGTAYYLQKVAEKLRPGTGLTTLVVFALNPLVIIESVVSSHNDIVMIFFTILSIWLLLQRKVSMSFLSLIFSIGIKFITGFLIPVFVYMTVKQKTQKTSDLERPLIVMFFLMFLAMLLAIARTNFQPWYFLHVFVFASILMNRRFILIPAVIFSFFALFQYIPYLYLGNYDPPVPAILQTLWIVPLAFCIILGIILLFQQKREQ
ncbi:MAG: hypothetical protein Q8Q49_01040 [bacterium]|nr:hypothetical protein [bacterium]